MYTLKYKYKAISKIGEVEEGFYRASSKLDVVEMLKDNNYLPITVEIHRDIEVDINLFSKKTSKKDISIFCRQFHTMLNAGVNIVKSLDIIEKQTENKKLKQAIFRIHEDLQKGLSLSESMEEHSRVFPELLINMVEVGETSGELDIVMEKMATHFEKENNIERKVKNAFIYPIILSIVSLVVVVFLLTVVMPTFIGMFENSDSLLPGPTKLLLAISNWLVSYWYLFIGIIALGIVIIIYFGKSEIGSLYYANLKIKTPMIKTMNIKIITSRFTRTMAILLSSGVDLLQALDLVCRVVDNKVIFNKLEIVKKDVMEGFSLAMAIKKMNVFPPIVYSMIKTGEESGDLSELLSKTADFYDNEVENSMEKMTIMMEPILIIIMALVVGFIVIAMVMPMFDMVNTMGL